MGSFFLTEVLARSTSLGKGLGLLLALALVSLLLLDESVSLVAWAAPSLVSLPIFLNIVATASEAREGRPVFDALLPLSRRKVTFVRQSLPALFQVLGTLLAALLLTVSASLAEEPRPALAATWHLGALLLGLGQWVTLQWELSLRASSSVGSHLLAILGSLALATAAVALSYGALVAAHALWSIPATPPSGLGLDSAQRTAIFALTALLLLAVNCGLCLRRDPITSL